MSRLKAAYRDCYDIIHQHSQTFTKAFSTLPESKRNAVWAVYAFCRKVDDIVDEGSNPTEELKQFEQNFDRFLRGDLPLTDSKWVALDDVFTKFDMDEIAFYDMIRGQRMDLTKVRYETLEELEEYSYHVASTVGLMLLPVLAPNNHESLRPGGIALGLAMQITNILRDIQEDLEKDRIYLPKSVMEKHSYTEEDLRHGNVNESFIAMWEELAHRAEDLYTQALNSMDGYPLDSRLQVKGSAVLYRAILKSVRKNDYNVFKTRHYVTAEEKQEILHKMEA
ncbi:phytoene/squalene synthase family protein [Bacillus sp. FJAT-45037]|uniref:phytoene/squalene synthase family protein n=1 Tax=Bacillus sp. FJAT-45037 TaxID=2011007 RepID=UPI0018E28485|nr:phytoene/squalene synthase family protein [Bacillus sp. FJAT-45037]